MSCEANKNPALDSDLLQLCAEPGAATLLRLWVGLPRETQAAIEQYLSGCFLESVAAQIEPDGSLRLDTITDIDNRSRSRPTDRDSHVRPLAAAQDGSGGS
ncbi:MAG: hypothetical protein ACXWJW_14725 [Xanthobacteraceae bacterium]